MNLSRAVASNPGGSSPANEGPEKAIDNTTSTKFLDFNKCPLVIDFGKETPIDEYTYFTANDFPGRDPISWKLLGSRDNSHWDVLDEKANYSVPFDRFVSLPYFIVTRPCA